MSRGCLSSLPWYSVEVTGRHSALQGPAHRQGYDLAHDAAGYPFPKGEPEPRALTVDQPAHRRPNPLVDHSGAAGNTRPKAELRVLDIDITEQRTRSAPPMMMGRSRTDAELTSQRFGIGLDVDTLSPRRRLAIPNRKLTRAESCRMAVALGDVDGLPIRRRFQDSILAFDAGVPAAGTMQSPRQVLAAAAAEAGDIDAYVGRKRFPIQHGVLFKDSVETWDSDALPLPYLGGRASLKYTKWSGRFAQCLAWQKSKGNNSQSLKDLEQGWQRLGNCPPYKRSASWSIEALRKAIGSLPCQSGSNTPNSDDQWGMSTEVSTRIPTPLSPSYDSPAKTNSNDVSPSPVDLSLSVQNDDLDTTLSSKATQIVGAKNVAKLSTSAPLRGMHRLMHSVFPCEEISLLESAIFTKKLKALVQAEQTSSHLSRTSRALARPPPKSRKPLSRRSDGTWMIR